MGKEGGDPLGLVGSILDRKYRVDRVVAVSGFGVVYAGLHLGMGLPIAVKVLRPDAGCRDDAWKARVDQFAEEATVLTRLRRSSVACVLDSGTVHRADASQALPWMVLEWLEGETLREDLARRRGRGGRSPSESIELLRPVLEAIADAHDLGIVHRDVKPSNIMLVRTVAGIEARVLDFGIAKTVQREEAQATASGTDTEASTRAFTASSAAPEQLSGARTGPSTDVYALGLLLTEVLTDRAPVPTDDPSEHYRATFAPTRPTPGNLGVDVGAWEKILARALSVQPEKRPRNARALLEELDAARTHSHSATGAASTAPEAEALGRSGRRVRRRRLARFALIVAALTAVAGGTRWLVAREASSPALEASARPLVVVGEFRADASSRSVSATFAEMLAEQLRIGGTMRLPPADTRAEILKATGGDGVAATVSPEVLARLRSAAGADVVVSGTVTEAGGGLSAEIELYDALARKPVGHIALRGPRADLNAFVRDAASRVRRALGRPALSMEDETALRSSLPENGEASIAYVEGLAARRGYRFREAAAHFAEAHRLSPRFAPALTALAQARLKLGEQELAKEAVERALPLAATLPRAEELALRAFAAETRHDWDGAIESYRALVRVYPDRADHVTALARSLVGAGRPREGVAALEEATRRPQNDWDLVRIHLGRAIAYARMSEDTHVLEAAREAERLATAVGARAALADALQAQGHAALRSGNAGEAEALFLRAQAIYDEVHDQNSAGYCESGLAAIARARGDFARAIEIGERLVAGHRQSGIVYRVARETVALAVVHALAGHLQKARELFDEGGRLFEAANDREGTAHRLVNLALVDIELGRFEGVAETLAQGREIHAAIGQRAGVAEADGALARLAWRMGDLATAETRYAEACAEVQAAADVRLRAELAYERARVAYERAAPDEAARFEEAEARVAAASDARLSALIEAWGARRALGRGDVAEARRRALASEERARSAHAPDAIVLALAIVLDAHGTELDTSDPALEEAARESRREELTRRVEALEAIAPAVEGLRALSRAARGAEAMEFAKRAQKLAAARHLHIPATPMLASKR